MANWQPLIAEAIQRTPPPVSAYIFIRDAEQGDNKPVVLGCADGHDYYVKPPERPRATCNEQIVGLLGQAIGAPVTPVARVSVPDRLIAEEPRLERFKGVVSHGSRAIKGVSTRQWIDNIDIVENRQRFASLAVLFAWAQQFDRQFIYSSGNDHLVFAVDLGFAFAGNGEWTIESLQAAGPAVPDKFIIRDAKLIPEEIDLALTSLAGVTDLAIAEAVASPCKSWGITIEERVAAAQYLDRRKTELVACRSTLF